VISNIIHTLDKNQTPDDWPKCPGCGRPLMSFQKHDTQIERFNLDARKVYGYCIKCGSSEMEQAKKSDAWLTIRFRFFVLKPQAWQKVNELPVPLVAVGS